MAFGLQLSLQPSTREELLQLQENRMGKIYDAIDYWENRPKLQARLQLGNREHVVNYVFAPPSLINYLAEGEKFGVYI